MKILKSFSCYTTLSHTRFLSTPSFVPAKLKATHLFFSLNDFDNYFNFQTKFISFALPCNEIYTVYIKIRYNQDNFFMTGNQFGFHYLSNHNLIELFDNVKIRHTWYHI